MGTPTKTVIPAAVSKSDEVLDPRTSTAGGVRLRGVTVALDTEVGQEFIVDCCSKHRRTDARPVKSKPNMN